MSSTDLLQNVWWQILSGSFSIFLAIYVLNIGVYIQNVMANEQRSSLFKVFPISFDEFFI